MASVASEHPEPIKETFCREEFSWVKSLSSVTVRLHCVIAIVGNYSMARVKIMLTFESERE